MRLHRSQTFPAVLAIVVAAALLCCETAIGTAKADGPANAHGLELPEALLLCQPLGNLERERVQLGQTRIGPEQNIYLYGRTDRSKTICF